MLSLVTDIDRETLPSASSSSSPFAESLVYLELICRDGATPTREERTTTATVRVRVLDVNDEQPHFEREIYEFTVDEGELVGTVVGRVHAADADLNATVLYELDNLQTHQQEGNEEEDKVLTSGRDGSAKGEAETEKEKEKERDRGRTRTSGGAEMKSAMAATESDRWPRGAVASAATPAAADGGDGCAIDARACFSIDASTGSIALRRRLDRELSARHEFLVRATDGVHMASTTVRLLVRDRNDNPPRFVRHESSDLTTTGAAGDASALFGGRGFLFTVLENQVPLGPIGRVRASDPDAGLNAQVSYSVRQLASEAAPPTLGVNPQTGDLWLHSRLDRELTPALEFRICARDSGSPSLESCERAALVVLDENDEMPRFTFPSAENGSVSVPVNAQVGTEVARAYATDADSGQNGRLTYSILSGNTAACFDIVSSTGVILLVKSLTEQPARLFLLTLSARDNGTPNRREDTAVLTIRVTSPAPQSPPAHQSTQHSSASGASSFAISSPERLAQLLDRELLLFLVLGALLVLAISGLLIVVLLVTHHNRSVSANDANNSPSPPQMRLGSTRTPGMINFTAVYTYD